MTDSNKYTRVMSREEYDGAIAAGEEIDENSCPRMDERRAEAMGAVHLASLFGHRELFDRRRRFARPHCLYRRPRPRPVEELADATGRT